MRVAQCRAVLVDFIRRWVVYLLVVLTVFGAGAYALSAIPLLWALSNAPSALWILPVYSAAATACLALCEPMLWSAQLAEEERFIPIPVLTSVRSDLVLGLWALTPLWAVLCAGVWATFTKHPPWLTTTPGVAFGGLALTGSFGAVLWAIRMRWVRKRSARKAALAPLDRLKQKSGTTETPLVSVVRAGTWLPVWRGVTPWTRRGLLAGIVAHTCGAVAATCWPELASWWLAIVSVSTMSVVRWCSGAARREAQHILAEARFLPISVRSIETHQRLLIALSCALSLLPMLSVVELTIPHHPTPWALYVSFTFVVWFLQLTVQPANPANMGFLWLVCSATLGALSSEVPL